METGYQSSWIIKGGFNQSTQDISRITAIVPPGPDGGISYNGIRSGALQERSSYHLGIFREWHLRGGLNFISGLSFRQKGGIMTTLREPALSSNQHLITNYISLDGNVKYLFGKNPRLQPYLTAGFRVDYLLSRNDNDYFDMLYTFSRQRRFDFGPVLGAGVQTKIGKQRILFEAEYNPGIFPVITPSLLPTIAFNKSYAFTIGFIF
ncbi:outer membrane beta-barrel protein [Rhodoflexus caldus]|uniref:outer membrane beta-barrel protein n=1 Tax=Rhodoflexus caldus TaxID=2891236 RepID=UPI00202A6B0D|nr:outer membrane beta-barrel protein [Rhodoflexus caldus]